jgi:hypothetical protein
MKSSYICTSCKVNFNKRTPYIETRVRVIRSQTDGLPEGKVVVYRTPILPPGATDDEIRAATTSEIIENEEPKGVAESRESYAPSWSFDTGLAN